MPVWVLSQTLVVNALSSTGVPGTNGFAIPSQNTDQLVALGETAYVPYVSSSSSSIERLPDEPLSPLGERHGIDGRDRQAPQGRRHDPRDARHHAREVRPDADQRHRGVRSDTRRTTRTSRRPVTVKSGGPVATGASVIDNAIASISYSPPVKVAIANNGAFGLILNDGGFDFSGRLDILNGNGDFLSMAIVVPNCGRPSSYVFPFQAFGASSGTSSNTSFVANGGRLDLVLRRAVRRVVQRHDLPGRRRVRLRHGQLHARRGRRTAPRARAWASRRPTRSTERRCSLSRDPPCPPRRGDVRLVRRRGPRRRPRPRGGPLWKAAPRPHGRERRGGRRRRPRRYAAKSVRVEGKNEGAAGKPSLKEGDAVLPIVTDGSCDFPADLAGGTLAAEGRAQTRDGRAVFVATGVEVAARDPALDSAREKDMPRSRGSRRSRGHRVLPPRRGDALAQLRPRDDGRRARPRLGRLREDGLRRHVRLGPRQGSASRRPEPRGRRSTRALPVLAVRLSGRPRADAHVLRERPEDRRRADERGAAGLQHPDAEGRLEARRQRAEVRLRLRRVPEGPRPGATDERTLAASFDWLEILPPAPAKR